MPIVVLFIILIGALCALLWWLAGLLIRLVVRPVETGRRLIATILNVSVRIAIILLGVSLFGHMVS